MLPALLGFLVILTACESDGDDTQPESASEALPADLTVTSTEFANGDPIPVEFSCDGANIPPSLAWTGLPDDTGALALVVDDPDAPGGTFTHWILLDIPVSTPSINADSLLEGVIAENSAGDALYTGPCPPTGDDPHTYRFTVYALAEPTGVAPEASIETARGAIDENAISYGVLTGTFAR
jgi:hypothetical protein